MTQTKVFDKEAHRLHRFTFDEINDALENNSDWVKDKAYVKSCIRDRIKKNVIVFDEGNNIYEYVAGLKSEKKTKSKSKSKTIEELIEECEYLNDNGKFEWNCSSINEKFKEECDKFLNKYKFTDAIIMGSTVDQLFEKLLENSYSAATSRTWFYDNAAWAHSPRTAADLKSDAFIYLINKIKGYTGTNYNEWHKEVCKGLIGIYSCVHTTSSPTVVAWTYGNSQKILNLAVKYVVLISKRLLTICPTHPFVKIGEPFVRELDCLHSIVDRYMIGASILWNKLYGAGLILPGTATKRSFKYKPWSKWVEYDYDTYVKSLFAASLCVCPFIWETIMWPVAKTLGLIDTNSSVIKYI